MNLNDPAVLCLISRRGGVGLASVYRKATVNKTAVAVVVDEGTSSPDVRCVRTSQGILGPRGMTCQVALQERSTFLRMPLRLVMAFLVIGASLSTHLA